MSINKSEIVFGPGSASVLNDRVKLFCSRCEKELHQGIDLFLGINKIELSYRHQLYIDKNDRGKEYWWRTDYIAYSNKTKLSLIVTHTVSSSDLGEFIISKIEMRICGRNKGKFQKLNGKFNMSWTVSVYSHSFDEAREIFNKLNPINT